MQIQYSPTSRDSFYCNISLPYDTGSKTITVPLEKRKEKRKFLLPLNGVNSRNRRKDRLIFLIIIFFFSWVLSVGREMYIIRSVGAFWIATPLITELQLQQLMLLSGYTGKSLTLCLCSVFHCKKGRKNSLRWVCQGLNVSSGWPEIRSIKKKRVATCYQEFLSHEKCSKLFFSLLPI